MYARIFPNVLQLITKTSASKPSLGYYFNAQLTPYFMGIMGHGLHGMVGEYGLPTGTFGHFYRILGFCRNIQLPSPSNSQGRNHHTGVYRKKRPVELA